MVLRLFGLALILAASVRLVQRTWCAVPIEHSEQKTELQLRGELLQRMVDPAAERDHELRNALAPHAERSQRRGSGNVFAQPRLGGHLPPLHEIWPQLLMSTCG
jgi:hypothetical protein